MWHLLLVFSNEKRFLFYLFFQTTIFSCLSVNFCRRIPLSLNVQSAESICSSTQLAANKDRCPCNNVCVGSHTSPSESETTDRTNRLFKSGPIPQGQSDQACLFFWVVKDRSWGCLKLQQADNKKPVLFQ